MKERKTDQVIFLLIWIVYYIYMIMNSIVFSKGSSISIIVNSLIFIYCFTYVFRKPHLLSKFGYIYAYLFFILLLIILSSSDFIYSIKLWMKFSIGMLCLPIGFDIFGSKLSISKLWSMLQLFLFLFLFNYIVSNVFSLGGSQYGTEAAGSEMGNLFDDALHTNISILTIMPFMLILSRRKNIKTLILISSFIIIVTFVLMKRMPIFCISISLACFIFLWRHLNRRFGKLKNSQIRIPAKYIYSSLIAFSIFAFIFSELFAIQYNARQAKFEAGLSQEGRTLELQYITNDIINQSNSKTFFFGKETFNTVGTYANGRFGDRMIHENFGIMLNGTGVLGLFLYLLFFCYPLILLFKYKKRVNLKQNQHARLLYIAYISLWTSFLATSFSGTIWLVLYPAIHSSLSGMILRYFHDYGEINISLGKKQNQN